jgi:hypothetical protein
MRSARLVAFALVWGCIGTGVLLACGGDDSSSSGGTPDASTSSSGGSSGSNTDGSTNPTAPVIVASNLTVYTGMTAVVDGSGTQAQTFAWTVKVIPNGSAVTTASLVGASTAKPSFRADVSGDFVLEFSATNAIGTTKKDVTVKAVPAPLFYMQTSFNEDPSYFEYRTVGTDGTGGHPIACRTNGTPDGGPSEQAGFVQQAVFLADMGQDWWEAPAGDPARVAFVQFDQQDGGLNATLGLGTASSTCQNPPVKVPATPIDGGNTDVNLIQPRFNHVGTRVAYLERREDNEWFIASVGYDGKDKRTVGKLCAQTGGDCFDPAFFPARPQWQDDQTIAWVHNRDPDGGVTGWEVMVAADSANPNPHVYMTCDGTIPRSFAVLKDGSVIANRQPDGGPEDLAVLKPATAGGACNLVRNLTNLPTPRSYARDFSISPDETEVAFVRRVEAANADAGDGIRLGGQVYTVPVSGTAAPAALGGTPQEAIFGPRYVAGATALAWNGNIAPPDGGNGIDSGVDDVNKELKFLDGGLPVIAVAPRDGGPTTYPAKSDPDAGTYIFGGGNGGSCDFRLDLCSMGPIRSGGAPTIGLTLASLLWLVRRRRNRRR